MTIFMLKRARTKTVATVGPACREYSMLRALVTGGVDVFRLNMAHGQREEHAETIREIRRLSDELGMQVGILVDLAGPKIRLGELYSDPTECTEQSTWRFVRGDKSNAKNDLTSNYAPLIDELSVGDSVMLADGTVSMIVEAKEQDSVTCRVLGGGQIRSRQGINLPGVNLSVPAITDADHENAVWAAKAGVDFVSLSFVRTSTEVNELKQLLVQEGSSALVIAKAEKREALDNLNEIVQAADGIMVARGDLGVEIDVAETPVAQKKIIEACRQHSKPVIVATQMLDSMQRSKRPTRAEASDVANAILDGADACMLSGETAIGDFPSEAVEMMNRIMLATEQMMLSQDTSTSATPAVAGVHPITAAVVSGAGQIAERLFAKLVVIATRSGRTARVKSKQRDMVPTLGLSDSKVTLRQMSLFWGITPLGGTPIDKPAELREFVSRWGREQGYLEPNDRIVFVTGTGVVHGAHNVLVVHEVE